MWLSRAPEGAGKGTVKVLRRAHRKLQKWRGLLAAEGRTVRTTCFTFQLCRFEKWSPE